jgi:hypothetical protein
MATAPPKTLLDEITDFLNASPSSDEIIQYRLPERLERRALELLERNREAQLTPDERAEMNEFMHVDHLMTMLKAKARLKLMGKA